MYWSCSAVRFGGEILPAGVIDVGGEDRYGELVIKLGDVWKHRLSQFANIVRGDNCGEQALVMIGENALGVLDVTCSTFDVI